MSRRGDRFPRARRRKGYGRKQVEAFLVRAEASAKGAIPPVTAAEIRRAGFDLVRRGYDTAAVDTALDQLEEAAMGQAVNPSRHGKPDPAGAASRLRNELTSPYRLRVPRAGRLRRGYDIDAVDDFLDRVATALDGGPALALNDVRAAVFPAQRRGYDDAAVDDLLDRVIDLLLMAQDLPRRQ